MPVQKHTENSHIPVCIFVSPSDSPLIFLYVKTNTSLFIDTWLNCVGECIHVPNTAAVSSFPFFFFFSSLISYTLFVSHIYWKNRQNKNKKMN